MEIGLPFEKTFEIEKLIQAVVVNTKNIIDRAPNDLNVFPDQRVSRQLAYLHEHNVGPYLREHQENLQRKLEDTEDMIYNDSALAKQYTALFATLFSCLAEYEVFEMEEDTMAIEYLAIVLRLQRAAKDLPESCVLDGHGVRLDGGITLGTLNQSLKNLDLANEQGEWQDFG
jgi:hypothetical protein